MNGATNVNDAKAVGFTETKVLSKLGKYEIRRELGRGAMGIVYEGFDPFIERTVAIKTVQKSLIDKSEEPETLGRFRREAQAAGRLSHPNIVAVYEYGEDSEVAFIAMEYIVGVELKEQFDKGKIFQPSEYLKVMVQLLDALEYSHARGVVHRDIKPANILITGEGQVKIADFGIARIESSDLTQVGTVLGTPSYMSPEQFLGQEVDRRSDIFSAGVILYQILAGARPFNGSNMNVIMNKVLKEAPPDLCILNPSIPVALKRVVEKAMAKRPADRFQTAAEFREALEIAVESSAGVVTPSRTSANEQTVKIAKPEQEAFSATVNFSMDDFDARLQASKQEANRRSGILESEPQEDMSLSEVKLDFDQLGSPVSEVRQVEKAAPVIVPVLRNDPGESSGLLAGLAQEAREKQTSRQSMLQESQARAKRVDDSLNRIIRFFAPFVRHVNEVEPAINRTYRFDARTVFSNLKWKDAVIDYRKQSISESALLDFVMFSVNLCAPAPVLLRRPWGPLDALKTELHHLRLRMVDAAGMEKKPKEAWLETLLEPNFPLQIQFKGNYGENYIDVSCRNIAEFGVGVYKLQLDDVTPGFLDSLGLFLLGRTDKLPEQLRRI